MFVLQRLEYLILRLIEVQISCIHYNVLSSVISFRPNHLLSYIFEVFHFHCIWDESHNILPTFRSKVHRNSQKLLFWFDFSVEFSVDLLCLYRHTTTNYGYGHTDSWENIKYNLVISFLLFFAITLCLYGGNQFIMRKAQLPNEVCSSVTKLPKWNSSLIDVEFALFYELVKEPVLRFAFFKFLPSLEFLP